jgi:hypothetical protein
MPASKQKYFTQTYSSVHAVFFLQHSLRSKEVLQMTAVITAPQVMLTGLPENSHIHPSFSYTLTYTNN